MKPRTIRLFMWGYQFHYATAIRLLAERVLEKIEASTTVEVLLVGVRRAGAQASHAVCVEPEVGRWPATLFDGLDAEVEGAIPDHPMTSMFFGDEPSMRDKPQWTRQAVITEAVRRRLAAYDSDHGVTSLVYAPGFVDDYDIAVVLQVPTATLEAHAELEGRDWDGEVYPLSFLRACLGEVLDVARGELETSEPGRTRFGLIRDATEVVQRAAVSFLRNTLTLVQPRSMGEGLFEELNDIAALRYEGEEGVGRLFIVADNTEVEFVLQLAEPVRLTQTRWARKLIEMATAELPLLATSTHILGLGRLANPEADALRVDFHGHQGWEIHWKRQALLRASLGKPHLPQEAISEARLVSNVSRLFPTTTPEDQARLWEAMRLQARLSHGSLVVIAQDAAAEAQRLARQGTLIAPTLVSPELLERASRIDGALLLDPQGRCYAIGVILDGDARDDCLPARGGRYNSAVRYVLGTTERRMAIVHSDDRTVDVVPLLRPRVSRAMLEEALAALQSATIDNYHRPRNVLAAHRFYLSAVQCEAANTAMTRIYETPLEVGELRIDSAPFEPHPDMDEGCYLI